MVKEEISRANALFCAECQQPFSIYEINTYSSCHQAPLLTQYDLTDLTIEAINQNERSMWRYAEVLPVLEQANIVSLGEGWTPLLKLKRLAEKFQVENLYFKDESANPTGSFKARGLSMAVSKAKELGIENCIIPTAGNAGGALAAYCAHAGMQATVVMPTHTPMPFKKECEYFGANLVLVDGLISDCARKVASLNLNGKYFDMSTMKEPYRLEGKKTMGYEIAEQLNWQLPDVILYPTGGGTGLIGMWKAFTEMIKLGWISTSNFPRFIAVQTENCKPVVDSFFSAEFASPSLPSVANGLSVPFPFAHNLIKFILQDTSGTAIAVSEQAIVENIKEIASVEGMLVAPEGAALVEALKILLVTEEIDRDEKILLLNTGSGYKYLENLP